MRLRLVVSSFVVLFIVVARPGALAADADVSAAVSRVIPPLMKQWGIPGMAVGVSVGGHAHVFTFGVSSLASGQPVSQETLFEVGSVTKTFTATLVAYAQGKGALSLSDPVERFLPELQGTPFGSVPLLNLATHTPGGLPLQVPGAIETQEQMLAYLHGWKPAGAPGTIRTYSNISVGALGLATARSLNRDFSRLVETELLPGLDLHHTYVHVPEDHRAAYAQGYTSEGKPVRMTPGVFWEQAYGIRTTIGDLLLFLEENIGVAPVSNPQWAAALRATHTGYIQSGVLTQDLMWEQYPAPVTLETLLQGNSEAMIFKATPATPLVPALPPRGDVWINKTGSTAGFGAYVAFIPAERVGIVLLANKSYPIPDRVRAGFAIIFALQPPGR